MKAIGAQDDRLMLRRFGWEKYAHLHKIGRVFTQNPGIVRKRKFMEEQKKGGYLSKERCLGILLSEVQISLIYTIQKDGEK